MWQYSQVRVHNGRGRLRVALLIALIALLVVRAGYSVSAHHGLRSTLQKHLTRACQISAKQLFDESAFSFRAPAQIALPAPAPSAVAIVEYEQLPRTMDRRGFRYNRPPPLV